MQLGLRSRLEALHGGPLDARVVAALVTCAASVLVLNYTAKAGMLSSLPWLASDTWGDLPAWGVRVGLRAIFYVALPFGVARLCGVRDFHLHAADFLKHVWICAALLAVVMPFVIVASYTPHFLASYPVCRAAVHGGKQLAVWLLVYGLSFFTVEFFYRGFLLTMLRPALGVHAVFVAMVPYVMIHFAKPPAETAGSIVSGIVLGTLALHRRSIWYGFIIHVTVGFSMELLALLHK